MKKYCPNCGKEVDEDARFCSQCGIEFNVSQKSSSYREYHDYNNTNNERKNNRNERRDILGTLIGISILNSALHHGCHHHHHHHHHHHGPFHRW